MDKIIDARFERVEKALTNLIDSIAKYSPSTTQANELAAADSDLGDCLAQLQIHQNNYARIQKLRKETAELDVQIKDTISLLWTTRREITATPTTSYPTGSAAGSKYKFTYKELLNYARRISRTTLPPPGVTNGVDLTAPAQAPQAHSSQNGGGASNAQTPIGTTASGAATPVANSATANGIDSQQLAGSESQQTQTQQQASSQATVTSSTALPEHMLPAVNLLEGAVFYPWPTEERIRGGALALNQQLRDSGVEPRGFDPAEEEERRRAAAEQERRETEERQRRLREEDELRRRRMRDEANERERVAANAEAEAQRAKERELQEDASRRGSVAVDGSAVSASAGQAAAAAAAEKKQFQFMGDLDDDDDED
ncbi:hypothetical protein VTK73DRAFT_2536 [Phialemonium thermophilum]|uniref:Mediator of RNA polymerase II transcription subunit 4 n=1 Tax=Phialemonium thermophilum TaxID=223376 RepID=A0ABR3X3Q0_9PEZI